jgi:hypothetical protein
VPESEHNHPYVFSDEEPGYDPSKIREELKQTGLSDIVPQNLFRITRKNEPTPKGGLFRSLPNYIELPPELAGVEHGLSVWWESGSRLVRTK